MKDAVIIDNSAASYMLQPECGVPIVSWYDDMSDKALYEYIPMLIEMSKINDMRDGVTNFVRNNQIDIPLAMHVLQTISENESRIVLKQQQDAERVRLMKLAQQSPQKTQSENTSPNKSPTRNQAIPSYGNIE
jgi:hypothetical protein